MTKLIRDIVYLNGPPGCGKDEIASIMAIRYNFMHWKFADFIKDIAGAALTLNRQTIEANKDKLHITIAMTIRQFLIWLSEEAFKPKFGRDIFGELIADKLSTTSHERIIFSDSGFSEEYKPVAFANFKGRNLLLEIERPGCNFNNDSRSYWSRDPEVWNDIKRYTTKGIIHNNRSLKMLRAIATRKICKELDIPWIEEYTPLE